MRRTPVSLPIALSVVTAACLYLSGCGPINPMPTPTPSVTVAPAPLFESDEEALAAAEKVYREYLEVVDSAFATGDTSRLDTVATGPALESAISAVERWVADGWSQVGSTNGTATDLVSFDQTYVEIHACLDVAGVEIVTAMGGRVELGPGPEAYTVVVGITFDDRGHGRVESEEAWDGNQACN